MRQQAFKERIVRVQTEIPLYKRSYTLLEYVELLKKNGLFKFGFLAHQMFAVNVLSITTKKYYKHYAALEVSHLSDAVIDRIAHKTGVPVFDYITEVEEFILNYKSKLSKL